MNSGLFFLFIVLMVIAGLVALGCFLYELITHIIVCREAAGKITFKQFKALYSINEDSWMLNDNHADYWDYKAGRILLCFSFLDEMRYIAWRKRKEHLKEKNEKNKYFQVALKGMQKDLEEYQERNSL